MSLAAVDDHVVTAEIVFVGPEWAKDALSKNMRNRKERPKKQAQYVKDMQSDNWMLTGEAIKFDWNDEMIDGQNRCRAIVASGKTVPMLVVSGLNPAVRSVVDTGVARTAADGISIEDGHPNAHLLAAIAKRAIAWENGFTWLSNYDSTHSEIRQFINSEGRLEQLERAITSGRKTARALPGTPTFYGFSFYACSAAAADDDSAVDAEAFFTALAEGELLPRDDPRLVLRNRLIKDAQLRGPSAEYEKYALLFRAWNAFREREALTKLQAPRGSGWNHKNFPRPY